MAVNKPQITEQDTSVLEITSLYDPIPLSRIIELRNKQLTYEEIGQIVGCTRQNIAQRLQPVMQDVEGLPAWKENRADVLAVYQHKLLNSLTSEELQKASPYQKVGMFGILYDKERLERGQSTANVSYADIVKAREQARQWLLDHASDVST